MVFVRTKEIPPGSGNYYAYRVRSYRNNENKVRQEIIKYIGPVSEKNPSYLEIYFRESERDLEAMTGMSTDETDFDEPEDFYPKTDHKLKGGEDRP